MKNSPQSVIESYKRRQRILPWIIGILAVLLVVAGVVILILSLGQGGSIIPPPATATPTVTETFTATATLPSATPTATSTKTLTPTATVTVTPLGPFEYTVQEKDTCWDLAIKFKVDLLALLALNNFGNVCQFLQGKRS